MILINMGIVGVDFGITHTGIAYSSHGLLAAPLHTVATKKAVNYLQQFCTTNEVSLIVIGQPEDTITDTVKQFGRYLAKECKKPIVWQDERLSSKKGQELLRHAGLLRKKRKAKDHAASAAVILQAYLDANAT